MCRTWKIVTPAALAYVGTVLVAVTFFQFGGATSVNAQSVSACDSYAHNYARSRTRGSATGSVARNTLVGAGIGSLLDGRRGARRGATLGLGAGIVGGGIAAYNDYELHFNRAFRRCMRI